MENGANFKVNHSKTMYGITIFKIVKFWYRAMGCPFHGGCTEEEIKKMAPSVTGLLLWKVPRGTRADRYKVLRRTYVYGHCSLYRFV